MSSPADAPGSPTKTCKICASEIPVGAIKCVKCGSFQNYRRYFDFGNTTIALLIALISVIGLAQKNISELYHAFFLDPLQPNIVANVEAANRFRLSILIQNSAANRIVLSGTALCRVPIFKAGVEFKDSDNFRYPKPSEISAVHLIVYKNPNEQLIVGGGQATTAIFVFQESRPEEGQPFSDATNEIRPYCFVSYIDQRGREDGLYVPINSVTAYFLQRAVSPSP